MIYPQYLKMWLSQNKNFAIATDLIAQALIIAFIYKTTIIVCNTSHIEKLNL